MKNKIKCFKDKNTIRQSIYFIFKFFIRLFNDLAFLPCEDPFSAAFTRPLNCPSNLAFFRRLRELFCSGTYAYGSGLFFRFISMKEKNDYILQMLPQFKILKSVLPPLAFVALYSEPYSKTFFLLFASKGR